MVATLGFADTVRLIVLLYSIFYRTFAQEEGPEGTSAENLSCVIYTVHVTSMDCTWEVGRNAPNDVQYFLNLIYFENDGESIECPQYKNNELGRHVGCHFPNMKVPENHITLQVTGSSKESPIQTLDHQAWPFDYEKLAPPQCITVNCRELLLYCKVEWKPPPTATTNADYCFKYQIKDELRNGIITKKTGETYHLFLKDKEYILKLRAAGQYCTVGEEWSDWSELIKFGCRKKPGKNTYTCEEG
ncbi:interleukin-5 receptor subunit alpha-like [Podarcis lilfordi]|uniref:Interleukin-5 receptor subunit alpha-like n=1 Tax=Podarcis lilfordi TaxID=74358 RepID=A0AA35K7Y4_9SAUR|nr:interleukin-5 receptor subunit alpha-like [Podarcis lilfordi]